MTNETKHTPGPWAYEAGDIMAGPPSRRVKVAQLVDGNGDAYSKREEQDARLIAAAPALLAALRDALPMLVRLGDFIANAEGRCDVILAARAAIAQAERKVS